MEYFDNDFLDYGTSRKKKFSNKKNNKNFPDSGISIFAVYIPFLAAFLILSVFYLSFHISAKNLKRTPSPENLSLLQKEELEFELNKNFPERTQILHSLPYNTVDTDLFINAKSAILIDTVTGNILFEKNADEIIPPASMTKLVEMYVVFDAVEKGEVSLDDIVPLPKESWAINLPSDASIMFLAEGQEVTLRELLLGLSIASGNDASIAVAKYVAGDMDSFVARMNEIIKSLGLEKTHFVESSGYSEKNITTAKEFAAFCRMYIEKFPFVMEEFHSQKILKYPLEHNLPLYKRGNGDTEAIIQYNTNKMLGHLEGVDGLKTGFIYESGYNIALTAKRDSRRFLSVTMGGPGIGSKQGNFYRNQDGETLMEFAFNGFADFIPSAETQSYAVKLLASKQKSAYLVPAFNQEFSVPFITGNSPQEAADSVKVKAEFNKCLTGEISKGKIYGELVYLLDGNVLKRIPLVADRDSAGKSRLSQNFCKLLISYSNCL